MTTLCCAKGSLHSLAAKRICFSVAEASNGSEAIEQFRNHRPDVTLMDLQMPVTNGNDAIRAIRKEFPDARIIVLTTYGGDAQAVQAFQAGASGYLLKSMMRKELAETIRSVHGGNKRIPPGTDCVKRQPIEEMRLAGSPLNAEPRAVATGCRHSTSVINKNRQVVFTNR